MSDERELIELARNGDRSAFRQLVDSHKRNVYYLALDLLGNHHDAEDLSQEVFIKAYRSISHFRGDAKFGSWLYRITANCCIDRRRKKHIVTLSLNHQENSDALEASSMTNNTAHPEKKMEARTIQKDIEKALAQLSPRERTVFVLRHYNELSLKEIGQMLEIADGTVKSLLHRAVRRLQKELAFYRSDLGIGKETS